jgi:RNA polymerase sigma factor (sigma-70 family)
MKAITSPEPGSVSDDLCVVVPAAMAGNREAWTQLVGRYTSMVRNVARGYGLNTGDVEDVVQTVWLRCFQRLSQLHEVRALPGWLKTTAQREALRLTTSNARSRVTDPIDLERVLDRSDGADSSGDLLRVEAGQAIRQALAELPPSYRELLTLLHGDARPSYRDIGRVLGMPPGSIGPTRARGLESSDELRPCAATSPRASLPILREPTEYPQRDRHG